MWIGEREKYYTWSFYVILWSSLIEIFNYSVFNKNGTQKTLLLHNENFSLFDITVKFVSSFRRGKGRGGEGRTLRQKVIFASHLLPLGFLRGGFSRSWRGATGPQVCPDQDLGTDEVDPLLRVLTRRPNTYPRGSARRCDSLRRYYVPTHPSSGLHPVPRK